MRITSSLQGLLKHPLCRKFLNPTPEAAKKHIRQMEEGQTTRDEPIVVVQHGTVFVTISTQVYIIVILYCNCKTK